MQRGKNSASPIPGRWWGPLSAGLGLSACFPPRTATAAVIAIGILGHLVFTWAAEGALECNRTMTCSGIFISPCADLLTDWVARQCQRVISLTPLSFSALGSWKTFNQLFQFHELVIIRQASYTNKIIIKHVIFLSQETV